MAIRNLENFYLSQDCGSGRCLYVDMSNIVVCGRCESDHTCCVYTYSAWGFCVARSYLDGRSRASDSGIGQLRRDLALFCMGESHNLCKTPVFGPKYSLTYTTLHYYLIFYIYLWQSPEKNITSEQTSVGNWSDRNGRLHGLPVRSIVRVQMPIRFSRRIISILNCCRELAQSWIMISSGNCQRRGVGKMMTLLKPIKNHNSCNHHSFSA